MLTFEYEYFCYTLSGRLINEGSRSVEAETITEAAVLAVADAQAFVAPDTVIVHKIEQVDLP